MQAKKVNIRILYNDRDISADISNDLISLTYTDAQEGESDELQITVDDSEGKWRENWYPDKLARIEAYIGYGDDLVYCGVFEIDEIEYSGMPYQMNISCLAAKVSKSLRTKNNTAYENVSLRDIAQSIAGKNGLTLQGNIENIRFLRTTQHQETDLGFLKRIASEYGYIFSVRGDVMTFTNITDLTKRNVAAELSVDMIESFSLKDNINSSYTKATVSYQNPGKKEAVTAQKTAEQVDSKYNKNTLETESRKPDTLSLKVKAETAQQAEKKAEAAMFHSNSKQVSGSINLEGNPRFLAGNNIELIELGNFSGVYNIERSSHRIDKNGGYKTSVEVKRIGFVVKERQKSAQKKKKKGYKYNYIVTQ